MMMISKTYRTEQN